MPVLAKIIIAAPWILVPTAWLMGFVFLDDRFPGGYERMAQIAAMIFFIGSGASLIAIPATIFLWRQIRRPGSRAILLTLGCTPVLVCVALLVYLDPWSWYRD